MTWNYRLVRSADAFEETISVRTTYYDDDNIIGFGSEPLRIVVCTDWKAEGETDLDLVRKEMELISKALTLPIINAADFPEEQPNRRHAIMPNAILFRSATDVEAVDHPLTLEALQETVGGWICPAFTVPSPKGSRHKITAYVDDEGLLKDGLAITALRVHPNGNDPLVGPMIVVGLDERTGDTTGLDESEIAWFMARLQLAQLRNRHQGTFVVPAIVLTNYTVEA